MRICILLHSVDKKNGGPSRSVPILTRGLFELGEEVTLLVGKSENMNLHTIEGLGVKILTIPQDITKSELEKIILSGHFDVIHLQMIWLPIYHYASKICRKNQIPYIITPRGTLEPWAYQGQGFFKNIKKKIAMCVYQKDDIQKASCVLATSKMEACNLKRMGITAPISVVPNGIDVSEYKCRTLADKPFVKRQILFLSRIHQKKGIELLIDAWEKLSKMYPEWSIVIAGNGEEAYIRYLKRMIEERELERCISFIPPVFGEGKYKLYWESSLFVLPTYSENFGMVIAEAMSCGVPVITTNGTPWQELNGRNLGWCIDLSVENLAKALCEAIDSGQDALFEKGQRCSEHIRNTYHYSEVTMKNRAVYGWILGEREKLEYVI